jgi:transposase
MKGEKSKKNEQNAILGQYEARPRRHFSEEFKRSKVKEIIAKKLKVSDLCKLYSVSSVAVYRWIYKYSNTEPGTKIVVEMESESQKALLLQQQVAELERKVGQKQLQIDYLEKLLEIASKNIGYDLKKNTDLKP